MSIYLAFDIGASSGRAIIGILENKKLNLKEIHRFENKMIFQNGHYFWNIYQIFEELKIGLKKCISDYNHIPQSIGIDTWGVDFGILNKDGHLIGLPFAYRDSITDGMPKELSNIIPDKELYHLTGLQMTKYNSLYQLFSLKKKNYCHLNDECSLLFISDILNYFFSGIKKNEYTIASTSQLLNVNKRTWENRLFSAINVKNEIVQELIEPGTEVGKLLPHICAETGCPEIPIVAVASHDTASAVVSAPAEDSNWAFLSSGTWSIMGIELQTPCVNSRAFELEFSNEGGVNGSTKLLKNIIGMWLIQECRRVWSSEKEYSWQEMVALAEGVEPFKYLINPDNEIFLNPINMPLTIANYCEQTGQGRPTSHAEIIRAIYDSLAFKYKNVLNQLEEITEKKITTLHIVGGGSNNDLLNQLTADVCGVNVVSGPTEATAIGNIMMQAKADKQVNDLTQIRSVIRNSLDVKRFSFSKSSEIINEVYLRFVRLN